MVAYCIQKETEVQISKRIAMLFNIYLDINPLDILKVKFLKRFENLKALILKKFSRPNLGVKHVTTTAYPLVSPNFLERLPMTRKAPLIFIAHLKVIHI